MRLPFRSQLGRWRPIHNPHRRPGSANPHSIEAAAVARALNVNPAQGLSSSQVQKRRKDFGSNVLQSFRPRPGWRILIDQFASLIAALLAVAAAVAWMTGDGVDAVAILIVLVLNASVGFGTEWQADRALDKLRIVEVLPIQA